MTYIRGRTLVPILGAFKFMTMGLSVYRYGNGGGRTNKWCAAYGRSIDNKPRWSELRKIYKITNVVRHTTTLPDIKRSSIDKFKIHRDTSFPSIGDNNYSYGFGHCVRTIVYNCISSCKCNK